MKFHKETIDFFVEMEEANGWSHTSYRILEYLLADQIEYDNGGLHFDDETGKNLTTIELFKDLTEQVENKINKQLYNEI